jgi:Protein of unknown function (DUF3047)
MHGPRSGSSRGPLTFSGLAPFPGQMWRSLRLAGLALCALCAGTAVATVQAAPTPPWRVAVQSFRLVERVSGPLNYYTILLGPPARIRSDYQPGYKTAVVGYDVKPWQVRATKLRWRWRALTLPRGGDECRDGKGDSAAVVYVSWKRGLRYHTLKYVWSAVGARGAVCDKKRNPFLAQDTIILESGGPLNEWRSVELDLPAEFRRHFEDGDAKAEVPDLFGVGLMSDGDQTGSPSSADFADFAFE